MGEQAAKIGKKLEGFGVNFLPTLGGPNLLKIRK